MSKHTIKGYIVLEKWDWEEKGSIRFSHYKPAPERADSSSRDVIEIFEHSFEIEVPDDFDPTPQIIAGLEAKKNALRLKLAAELRAIDDRISKLLALPFHAAEA